MVIKENYGERDDGVKLIRFYSDTNHYIIQNQTHRKYAEAVDVEFSHFTYSESDELIESEDELNA